MWDIKSQYIQIQTSIFIYETNLWKILYVFKEVKLNFNLCSLFMSRALCPYLFCITIHFCMLTGLAVHT